MTLRERKVAKKKEEILRSALSIVAEKGYHGTTMEEIAAQLLMTKGSVYYYFKDKQDLLYQSQVMILEQSIEQIRDIMSDELPVVEKLRKGMTIHIEYAIKERSGFEMMMKPGHIFSGEKLEEILRLRDVYAAYFDQLITEGKEAGIFAAVDEKVVRNLLLGAMNWVTQWYSPTGKKNETEMADTMTSYLLRMLVNE